MQEDMLFYKNKIFNQLNTKGNISHIHEKPNCQTPLNLRIITKIDLLSLTKVTLKHVISSFSDIYLLNLIRNYPKHACRQFSDIYLVLYILNFRRDRESYLLS